ITVTLAFLAAVPAMAADPVATKRLVAQGDGASVLAIEVSASSSDVYGVMISDDSGSIIDIVAPKGWVGITSGERVLFRSDDKPIESGKRLVFTVLTKDGSAPLAVTFRGAKTMIGGTQSI
ncbi:MAG: hypothetical protein P8181_12590, partial [bacterium]